MKKREVKRGYPSCLFSSCSCYINRRIKYCWRLGENRKISLVTYSIIIFLLLKIFSREITNSQYKLFHNGRNKNSQEYMNRTNRGIELKLFDKTERKGALDVTPGKHYKQIEVKQNSLAVMKIRDENSIGSKIRDANFIANKFYGDNFISMEAMSSKSKVYLSINGGVIYQRTVKNSGFRGIHVLAISQYTGSIMAAKSFDTFMEYDSASLVTFLNSLQHGRIVAFIVGDEASYNLKSRERMLISKMYGSRMISRLGWRDTWAFACEKGVSSLGEEVHHHNTTWGLYGEPSVLKLPLVKLRSKDNDCQWEGSLKSHLRKQFCSQYEGYGALCRCHEPDSIEIPSMLDGSRVEALPIAVMASNRPHYLYRMLKRLLRTRGVDASKVTVFIDGSHEEPSALARLLNLAYVNNRRFCQKSCGISQNYKNSLAYTFNKYQTAKYMIILEEDLDVAPDIMDYFNQALPILERDDSVFCISAWNDQGYKHSSNDPSLLYRVETMPGLGWVLKRTLFEEELKPNWPRPPNRDDWDIWVRADMLKGRECIIPDISRTFHFGTTGVHMSPFFHHVSFANHALNTKTGIRFDISKMTIHEYEAEMHKLISSAEILDHSKSPCVDKDFIPDTSNHTYVFYIKFSKAKDYETWEGVAGCFHLWNIDVRGFHKRMFRLWMKRNRLFVVGSTSPYAVHKPRDLVPIFIGKKKNKIGGNR